MFDTRRLFSHLLLKLYIFSVLTEDTSGRKCSRLKCEVIWNFLMREKEKVPF